jgi:hypothetical protein
MFPRLLLAAFLAALPLRALAQSETSDDEVAASPASDPYAKRIGYEPKEKFLFGTDKYFDTETSLYLNLAQRYNINAGYQMYDSNVSSKTSTISFGLGKDWEQSSFSFLYSNSPKQNDYQMSSVDLIGTIMSGGNRDFRSSLGLDFNVTNHKETVEGQRNSTDTPIRAVTPTLTGSQRYYGWKLSLEWGHTRYDRDLQLLSSKIRPNALRLQGLAGLLQGFPDVTVKYGLSYDFDETPATFWSAVTHIRMIVTNQIQLAVSDEIQLGFDYDVAKYCTAGIEYENLSQSGQPDANYWGGTVTFRL